MPLDPEEEKKFAELRDKCRELKVMPPPEIKIGIQVHDKDGNLTYEDIQRGHSWNRNFYNLMFAAATLCPGSGSNNFGAGYMSGKSPAGVNTYGAGNSAGYFCSLGGGAGVTGTSFVNPTTTNSYGIVVGTGDTAFDKDQYALASIIASGNSSGQLAYNAMAANTIAYTAGSKTWKATSSRIFNNNSGGSISVKETGLYFYGSYFASGYSYNMIERSVLSPTVAVANGAQLTVTYEISMDFSDID